MTMNSSIFLMFLFIFLTIVKDNGFEWNTCRGYCIVYLYCILLEIIIVIGAILHVWVARVKPVWSILITLQHNENTCTLLVFFGAKIFSIINYTRPTKCLSLKLLLF